MEHPVLSAFLFFAFALLSVTLGPVTSVPLVPFGVIIWGEGLVFSLLLFGWVCGGLAAYFLGSFLGHPVVARIIGDAQIAEWRDFVSSRRAFIPVLLFRFAMPAETGYIFGLFRYDIVKFMVITLVAEIPLAIGTVWASEALISRNFLIFTLIIAVMISSFILAGYLLNRILRKNIAE